MLGRVLRCHQGRNELITVTVRRYTSVSTHNNMHRVRVLQF